MALVRRSAAELLAESKADRLHELLSEQARFQLESRVGVSEVRSWRRSLPVLLGDLADAGLEHVEVLLEHKLPHSPKRVDAVLCGTHPRTGEPSYVLVELKQWSEAELVLADLVRVASYGEHTVLHPVEQVKWVARREYSHDPAVKKADDIHFGALIRNTYKVLLTHGMAGACVYSTDPETQEFLQEMTR